MKEKIIIVSIIALTLFIIIRYHIIKIRRLNKWRNNPSIGDLCYYYSESYDKMQCTIIDINKENNTIKVELINMTSIWKDKDSLYPIYY